MITDEEFSRDSLGSFARRMGRFFLILHLQASLRLAFKKLRRFSKLFPHRFPPKREALQSRAIRRADE